MARGLPTVTTADEHAGADHRQPSARRPIALGGPTSGPVDPTLLEPGCCSAAAPMRGFRLLRGLDLGMLQPHSCDDMQTIKDGTAAFGSSMLLTNQVLCGYSIHPNLSKWGLEIDRREGFTGRTMTQFGSMTRTGEIGSRLCRLPLVVLLTVGLLFSLLHCAMRSRRSPKPMARWRSKHGPNSSPPDMPEHLLPCDHCLVARHRAAM